MIFDRRAFLRNGVALGFGSWVWSSFGRRMGQSLAATNGQKLGLLLDIGRGESGRESLPGCATDLELLGEVLQGRYGFSGDNLVSFGPDKETLPRLETVFDQHLRQRVQKGDAVVVAFSGYGSYSPPEDVPPSPTWEQALPYLGLVLPGDGEFLPLTTLISWLQSLKTKRVYLILDCGFSNQYVKFQGNLRSRSAGLVAAKGTGEVENTSTPIVSSKIGLGNVTLISGASPGQTAVEGQLGKVTAGLFTVALCQSLWENTAPNLIPSLWDHSRNLLVPRLGNQQIPQWKSPNNAPDFLIPNGLIAGGEGVVTALQDETSLQSHIWGLNPLVQKRALLYSCYLTVSKLKAPDNSNNANDKISSTNIENLSPLWQVHNLKGQQATLTAIANGETEKSGAKPSSNNDNLGASLVGSSLREMYRALPKSLALTVALADDLERIERVDATSAFGAITSVESVINAGEGSADCVFGPLETHRYSLFTEGGDPLQPLTKSESSGAVKTVVSALEPCLNRLLALKWLTLLANGDSTRLGVAMDLIQQTSGDNPLPRLIYQWRSTRFPNSIQDISNGNKVNTVPNAPPTFLPAVATNQALQCQLENLGEEPLYGCLIGVNNRGLSVAGILHPELKLLQPQERLVWPPLEDPLWLIGGDKAIAHWFLILSRFALPGTVAALGQQFTGNNPTNPLNLDSHPSRVIVLKDLLPVVLALVEDLSIHRVSVAPVPDDIVLLATADWLSLPIMYQVL